MVSLQYVLVAKNDVIVLTFHYKKGIMVLQNS
jgi:hypothetical protein